MKGELQRGEVARSILSHVPETRNPELMEVDRELEELLKRQHSKVRVFGVGGAGSNPKIGEEAAHEQEQEIKKDY